MAELLYSYFDALIYEVNALSVRRSEKDRIIQRLQFLRTQALADTDRRRPTIELREVWTEVDQELSALGLYESYRPPKKVWDAIGLFVEVGQYRRMPAMPAPKNLKPSPLENSTELELVQALRKECAGIPFVKIRAKLLAGFKFLESEAQKPKADREHDRIQMVWREIHPDLKHRRVLKLVEDEPMKSRILGFLKGE